MATTRYIVAATASSPEPKVISNLKAARAEADARAKLDRVDVEVRTQATDKVSYTAHGAPAADTALADPVTVFADAIAEADAAAPADQDDQDDTIHETATAADMDEVEKVLAAQEAADPELAAMIAADDEPAAPADELTPVVDDATRAEFDAVMAAVLAEDVPAADTSAAPVVPVVPVVPVDEPKEEKDPERKAPCGCLVEQVIASGEHQKGCAAAPARKATATSVKKDPQPKPPTTRSTTGRREALGASVVDGWDLLYDKPRQKAQVGRNATGYALICTDHKKAHKLARLTQERGLRQGKRSAWCPDCTN